MPVMVVVVSALFCALLALAASAWATAPKQYLLKHPKHEHCKANYVKKTESVKKHVHGNTEKVRETFCVYVAPKPATSVLPYSQTSTPVPTPPPTPTPAPTPPPEPKLIPSIMRLEIPRATGPECETSNVLGGSQVRCLFNVKWSISTTEGVALNSPFPTFTVTNPGAPGQVWTFPSNGNPSFILQVDNEKNESFKVDETFLLNNNEVPVAKAHGHARWSMYANYAGTGTFAPSQSGTQEFASPFF
jgi:hypothetical protein